MQPQAQPVVIGKDESPPNCFRARFDPQSVRIGGIIQNDRRTFVILGTGKDIRQAFGRNGTSAGKTRRRHPDQNNIR